MTKQVQGSTGLNTFELDLSELPSSQCIYKVTTGTEVMNGKLIKK